jgi:hypothetical protein
MFSHRLPAFSVFYTCPLKPNRVQQQFSTDSRYVLPSRGQILSIHALTGAQRPNEVSRDYETPSLFYIIQRCSGMSPQS